MSGGGGAIFPSEYCPGDMSGGGHLTLGHRHIIVNMYHVIAMNMINLHQKCNINSSDSYRAAIQLKE